jgi:hypothetical protein
MVANIAAFVASSRLLLIASAVAMLVLLARVAIAVRLVAAPAPALS